MEALSEKDVNARAQVKQTMQKPKAAPAKALTREKDHPPTPPSEILEPSSSDRPSGAIYYTGRLLGKGGFAICHEAQLSGTRVKYALKVVKSRMPQKKMEQKFQTELQIHSKMRHANIVQFHRAFSFEQSTYIVLELCPNGSLMDMVKKRRFLTEPEVRFYTIQIAGAIRYMHAKGIIHRDLKMGNVFLDEHMNIKVGDFGLAALLVSGKDMTAVRRTTLCGTPNYIAPEILEKGKGGHDHAVDIWSLGIIIFAMLTGKPPFQSSTQEEIYRKAREREYVWPELDTSDNHICDEAKELVTMLLQDADQRPAPDVIVQHPFFSCGWVPDADEMTPKLRTVGPEFRDQQNRTRIARNLKKLCQGSEVGPATREKRLPSTYKEMAAEEKAGLTPAVPLPSDVVYRPFDEILQEQGISSLKGSKIAEITISDTTSQTSQSPNAKVVPNVTSARAPAQSFAAQQRAQAQPLPNKYASLRSTRSRATVDTAKSQKEPITIVEEIPDKKTKFMSLPTRKPKAIAPNVERQIEKIQTEVQQRLGADLAHHLGPANKENEGIEKEKAGKPERVARAEKAEKVEKVERKLSEEPKLQNCASLFSPAEKRQELPGTRPEQVLRGLQRFHQQLEEALAAKAPSSTHIPPAAPPTIVVKWVDYTNKFGLGYILSNGSVGCIFKAAGPDAGTGGGILPPSCVVVRDSETHLQNRANESYPDRYQIVPIKGPGVEFYEHKPERGISRVIVPAQNFEIGLGPNGEALKLSRGKDEFDDRKRSRIVLWKKFANYMTAYGRDQDFPIDQSPNKKARLSQPSDVADVVTFYQRFGDVGCWVFGDGHFQFNFPDHTKIILSADGTWCDFYHLSLEAARDLAQTGALPPTALDDRQHLSYPTQTLLNFVSKPIRSRTGLKRNKELVIDPMIQGLPSVNDFRRKIEFIKEVSGEWLRNGGLGNSEMNPETRLRWLGYRETVGIKIPFKHVWVTVGARGGDDRRNAWFDPRAPGDVVADIEP